MGKKNIQMLQLFFAVVKKEEKAIGKVVPKMYHKTIFSIPYKKLKELGIQYLFFDIDNTITAVNDLTVSLDVQTLFCELKKEFTIYLFSNNKRKRVEPIAHKLQIEGIAEAEKPTENALTKIKKIAPITKENTAIIGDQLLTDIVFGNTYGFYTILVEPFRNKYDIKTGVSRVLQNIIMKKRGEIKRYRYY